MKEKHKQVQVKPPNDIPGEQIRPPDRFTTMKCPNCKRLVNPKAKYDPHTGETHWYCPYCRYQIG